MWYLDKNLDLDCRWRLPRLISAAFSHYYWGRSGLPQDFPTVVTDVNEFCLHVSSCHSRSFTEPSNLSTRTRGFWVLAHGAEWPGERIPLEMVCLVGRIPPWKFQAISSAFAPWKSQISSPSGMPPPPLQVASFSSTKMGSFDIEALYSTLCPRITSTCFISKFHLNMFQNSIWGDVMFNAITYGQDCTLKAQSLCPVRRQKTDDFVLVKGKP